MTYLDRFQQCLLRTQQISPHRRSQLTLLQEFLRRERLWARALHMKLERPAHDFYDLARTISPVAQFPGDIFDSTQRLRLNGPELALGDLGTRWYWLRDNQPARIVSHDLPDPYEPLVWFFERGGRIAMEHGILDIPGVAGVKYDTFIAYLEANSVEKPLLQLETRVLDEIDGEL